MPFFGVGMVTGYVDPDPIPADVRGQLVSSARIIMDEFGLEAFGKWMNIGVFAGIYGLCGYNHYNRYLAFKMIQNAVPADAKVKNAEPVNITELRPAGGTGTDTAK